ncbi:MAG: hypothetical protein A3C93_02350 [Candidatus Lloydbacteria bacterium RIFCSPHIGHO2_02_FULL_54_17]|uniref:Uncharacterized protein n=1 Tax=Candidatus Lloydbacteria bacterium RIFCSPHIGHO2_02_FULL_54_17 TaxID=1798664 RepID=A0A1G2DDP0_9BACT|nr:MAG: hypothetical protein A2762_04555 [Candidatus Lloydbacteria bacterium RIFCSPHIGHO2_01_FULL_54_11]OGZ11754.1 MAG: hypothetical protein A3C93_02350 [Candidatus Lloydbacteria bacterium RIFCSPHIGHO2_02_FULL_54_17]OGZ14283.1 MAG: hypothetical protein A2948_01685 [Candidatus Lloydbacteria bacterium RIFCSPLOWO2_01_FULL_54_18]OGZ16049.1 MAG: hypothetical protein A3H76_00800 [Candidatus Lloydbacteria bacterium RIFCSPLOWO2_02_FULL_54_12]
MPEDIFASHIVREKAPVFIVAGVALILLGVLGFLYMDGVFSPIEFAQPKASVAMPPQTSASYEESLGGTLYEKANNPLEDKLPEADPTANPLEDAYKNPF